jgi:hypothetical protein
MTHYVKVFLLVVRHSEVDVQIAHAWIEEICQRFGGRYPFFTLLTCCRLTTARSLKAQL